MMNRRNAIATSVASVMVVASIALSALAVTDSGTRSGAGELASGRPTTVTVVEDEFVDDVVYATSAASLPTAAADATAADGAPISSAPGLAGPTAPSPTPAVASPGGDAGAPPTTGQGPAAPPAGPGPNLPNPTIAPSPAPTTVPATTPTTWPPGTELPETWPAGVPYPPIPDGCSKPHLEDDGRWNCER